jgi:hypothetical protein
MAQRDAAGVNGSNRIIFHGAPPLRMMPNGCLGSPELVLLFGLDSGFLMDVGPEQLTQIHLRPPVDHTGARSGRNQIVSGLSGPAGEVTEAGTLAVHERQPAILLPLNAPRRRHAKSVPDALKNRQKAASLAKRSDGNASIIQPRPRRESPELSLVIPPVSMADPAPVASRVRSLRAHCARGWLTIAGMNARTAT